MYFSSDLFVAYYDSFYFRNDEFTVKNQQFPHLESRPWLNPRMKQTHIRWYLQRKPQFVHLAVRWSVVWLCSWNAMKLLPGRVWWNEKRQGGRLVCPTLPWWWMQTWKISSLHTHTHTPLAHCIYIHKKTLWFQFTSRLMLFSAASITRIEQFLWGQICGIIIFIMESRNINWVKCFIIFTVVAGCAVSTFKIFWPSSRSHSPGAYYLLWTIIHTYSPGRLNWPFQLHIKCFQKFVKERHFERNSNKKRPLKKRLQVSESRQ